MGGGCSGVLVLLQLMGVMAGRKILLQVLGGCGCAWRACREAKALSMLALSPSQWVTLLLGVTSGGACDDK